MLSCIRFQYAAVLQGSQGACTNSPNNAPLPWVTADTISCVTEAPHSYVRHLTDIDASSPDSSIAEPTLHIVKTGGQLLSVLRSSSTNVELQNHIYLPFTPDVSSLKILRVRFRHDCYCQPDTPYTHAPAQSASRCTTFML